MLTEPADPLLGAVLGKDYVVLEKIGVGGMAVVYLVEHQTLKKRFAVKVLSQELTENAEARARFNQEAHAASALDHENIVTISDFGVTPDRRPYFVMELLRGRTLDLRLAEGPLTVEELTAISVSVGRALAYAHAEGIVHRDIKPENIFLVQRSQNRWGIKVVDFGIAKAPVNGRLTKMGEVLGTPMYMAPEACRGDDVDHRADIYSFGILLYQMVCGRLPYEDTNLLKLLQMQLNDPLPPPRSINPDLSPELEALLLRALDKDPNKRFQDMEDLLAAFTAALPAGSDRMLVEMQTGVIGRITPTSMTHDSKTGMPRASASGSHVAQIPISNSQKLPKLTPSPRTTAGISDTLTSTPVKKKSKAPLMFVLVALLGGGAAAAVALTKSGKQEPAPATAGGPVAEPAAGAPAPTAPTGSDVTTAPAAPVPTTVALKVHSTPSGATVKLDGKTLGETPYAGNIDKSDHSAKLVLSKPGHEDLEREIDLAQGATLEVTLRATRVAAPTPKRHAPPPPKKDKPTTANAGSATKQPDPALDIRLSR